MSEINEILNKIPSGNISWDEFDKLMKLPEEKFKEIFKTTRSITDKKFGQELKIYIPSNRFPAISITGNECALHCEHCNIKYLEGMKHLTDNQSLKSYLLELSEKDGVGALISGGCQPDGSVPLYEHLDAIKQIKKETQLIINAHTGLLNEETAEKLAEAEVDIISFDINMDEEIVEDIYHLDKNLEDYKRAVNLLKKHNLNIVPHICIGLYYGNLHKELESLKFIKESQINPSLIVLIALIPPKKGETSFKQPTPFEIAKIIALTRLIFPETEISLGCMRPRGKIKNEVELYAYNAGITRIEIPSPKTLKKIKKTNPNVEFKFISACCAIPKKCEEAALSKESEIRRYQIL